MIGDAVQLPAVFRWLVLVGAVLVVLGLVPIAKEFGVGIVQGVERRGAAPVLGEMLIYSVLLIVFGWLTWQVAVNAADNFIPGRRPLTIAPLVAGGESGGKEGLRLARVLNANLMTIQDAADTASRISGKYVDFGKTAVVASLPGFNQLPEQHRNALFDERNLGPGWVGRVAAFDTAFKFEVSGADLTPMISWLISWFQRRDTMEITLIGTKDTRILSWNDDTARFQSRVWQLENVASDDEAVETFAWEYARTLSSAANGAVAESHEGRALAKGCLARGPIPALQALSWRQYKTLILAYRNYATAVASVSAKPEAPADPSVTAEFSDVFDLLTNGATKVDDPAQRTAANTGSLKDATAGWWELSKFFALTAALGGRSQEATRFATQTINLLPPCLEKPLLPALLQLADPDGVAASAGSAEGGASPDRSQAAPAPSAPPSSPPAPVAPQPSAVIAAPAARIEAQLTPSASPLAAAVTRGVRAAAGTPSPTTFLLLSEHPVVEIKNAKASLDGSGVFRVFERDKNTLLVATTPVEGSVSAVEAIERLTRESGYEAAPKVVAISLPLQALRSRLLVKAIEDNFPPATVVCLYTKATREARADLQALYPRARVSSRFETPVQIGESLLANGGTCTGAPPRDG